MQENEPQYFKEFKNCIESSIDDIKTSINDLAVSIKDTVATKSDISDLEYELSLIRNEMATKQEVHEMLVHIGRYEVRSQNTEDTLHNDHKPRIIDLEKKVFA